MNREARCHNGTTQLPGAAGEFLKGHQDKNRAKFCFSHPTDSSPSHTRQEGSRVMLKALAGSDRLCRALHTAAE